MITVAFVLFVREASVQIKYQCPYLSRILSEHDVARPRAGMCLHPHLDQDYLELCSWVEEAFSEGNLIGKA